MSRLGIVTALMCEATPLIDFYQLKKQVKLVDFHHYRSNKIDLIVVGVGALKASQGVCSFCDSYTLSLPKIWLNVGVAGAKNYAVGELCWVDEIKGMRIASINGNGAIIKLFSLSLPDFNYHANALFDMEAENILETLLQKCVDFMPRNFFCAKVISDNSLMTLQEINKSSVSQLIRHRIEEIDIAVNSVMTETKLKNKISNEVEDD